MLVVPVINLLDGQAVDYLGRPRSGDECSFADPIKTARLWRVQNAAVIHLIDQRSLDGTHEIDFDSISRISRCLDIPIQLEARFTVDTITEALDHSNVARVIVREDEFSKDDRLALLDEHPATQLCLLLNFATTADLTNPQDKIDDLAARVNDAYAAGSRRIVVRDKEATNQLSGYDAGTLAAVAKQIPRMKFSASGGIGSYRDLKSLELECPRNVDSVIIGRALYENRFPCQDMWCWHQKEQVDLEKFSSATLRK